jgi:hypothetical protein
VFKLVCLLHGIVFGFCFDAFQTSSESSRSPHVFDVNLLLAEHRPPISFSVNLLLRRDSSLIKSNCDNLRYPLFLGVSIC